jgi:hypothetical protein
VKNGWYILNYHNVSWEDGLLTRGIGGSFPPDVFYEQVRVLSQEFELMEVVQAHQRLLQGPMDKPVLSFWFDDGMTGVRRYAKPVLDAFETQAAISVNSRFTLGEEMFWRFKLSYLHGVDGLRFLRSRLRKLGLPVQRELKWFTADHFSKEVLAAIDEVYKRFSQDIFREKAFELFDSITGLQELEAAGWLIANHSAAHYPVSEDSYLQHFEAQFRECQQFLDLYFKPEPSYWVLPFDRPGKRSTRLEGVLETLEGTQTYVYVGNQINQQLPNPKIIHRIGMPQLRGAALIRRLENLPLDQDIH